MEDKLENAFAKANNEYDNNDYLLMAILKRFSLLMNKTDENYNSLMERISQMEEKVRPKLTPSPS